MMRLSPTHDERRLEVFLLAADTGSEGWMRKLLVQHSPSQVFGRMLLKQAWPSRICVLR